MWIQFGLSALVRAIWPKHFRPPQRPTVRQYGQKVLPPALATAVDIGLSNTSLKDITLTFYTMVKNSSLIFVLIFAFLFRLEVFSLRLIGVMFLILVGVILMVATETSFSLSGFLLVISASACAGLRWSLTQVLLKKDRKQSSMGLDSPPAALFWMTPAMGLILAGLSLIVDGWINVIRSRFFDDIATSLMTGVYIIIPGIMAFSMVLSEFYIIQRVGVVPMAVAGIFKEVATISVSAWLFGDRLTLLNIFGAFVAFCGIGLFTYHKYRKSIESPIALDEHGNPIEVDKDIQDNVILEEIRPLTHSGSREVNGIEFTLDSAAYPLFSVGPESDGDLDEDGNTRQSIQDIKVNANASRDMNGDVTMADRDSGASLDDELQELAK